MAIKFAASEPPILAGGIGPTSNTARFNTTYSRGGIYTNVNAPVTAEIAGELATGYWVSFYLVTGNDNPTYYDYDFCKVLNSAGELSLLLSASNQVLTMRIYADDGSTVDSPVLTSGVAAPSVAAMYTYHLEQSGSDIVVTAYLNGSVVGTGTHLNKTCRGLKSVQILGGLNPLIGAEQPVVSEVMIADESLVGAHVLTIPPTGDGTHTDWSGSYADIAAIAIDSASITASDTDDTSTFTHAAISTSNIHSVLIACSASEGTGADLKGVLRIGAMDYAIDFLGDFTANETPNFAVWAQSPATGSAFTGAEVSAMEWGFKRADSP